MNQVNLLMITKDQVNVKCKIDVPDPVISDLVKELGINLIYGACGNKIHSMDKRGNYVAYSLAKGEKIQKAIRVVVDKYKALHSKKRI